MRFLGDLRYAGRAILKSPAFAVVAVLTLALGVGATVASFSLFEAVQWNWLPFPDLDRLVALGQAERRTPDRYRGFSGPDYLTIRNRSNSYSSLSAQEFIGSSNLGGSRDPESVSVEEVTANYFPTLGLQPALGRLFTPAEEKSANAAVALLTYDEWRRHFAADPQIIGKTIILDDQPRTIVGVLPRRYLEDQANIFVPMTTDNADFLDSKRTEITLIGRLAPRKTAVEAKAELDQIVSQPGRQTPESKEYSAWLQPLRDFRGTAYFERRLFLFLGVAALVLLIACINVANLLLARSVERQSEFAVRSALGAGRWPLMRQVLAESLVLATAAAAVGVGLAVSCVHAIAAFASPAEAQVVPDDRMLTVDGRALAFALAIAFFTAILFGAGPAFIASKVQPERWLRSGGRSHTASRARQRWRDALVLTEVALALVITFAGGLFARSLRNLEKTDLGFNSDHLLTVRLWLRGARYNDAARIAQFYDELVQHVRALPGVRAAAVADFLPMTSGWEIDFTVVGGAPARPMGLADPRTIQRLVGPGFFQTLGIPVLLGRGIDAEDTATSERVVVVNENLARHYFGSVNPIGHQLKIELRGSDGLRQSETAQIVGVARNVHEVGIGESGFDSIYAPFSQFPDGLAFVAVRSAGDAQETLKLVRKEIAVLDSTQPVLGLPTMSARVQQELAGDRFNTTLIMSLSFVALLLAVIGIYAVLAYAVNQRVHEIGIRMALGARATDVLGWIVIRSGRLVLGGVAVGTLAALVTGKLLGSSLYLVPTQHEGMLYGVSLYDPLTLLAATVLLGITALAASYAPARRATRVDPMEALRCE